jgi:hypothetical protein
MRDFIGFLEAFAAQLVSVPRNVKRLRFQR